jgi:hypothetical protein
MFFSRMLFCFLKNFALCFTTDDKTAVGANIPAAKAFFHFEHLLLKDIAFTPLECPNIYAVDGTDKIDHFLF